MGLSVQKDFNDFKAGMVYDGDSHDRPGNVLSLIQNFRVGPDGIAKKIHGLDLVTDKYTSPVKDILALPTSDGGEIVLTATDLLYIGDNETENKVLSRFIDPNTGKIYFVSEDDGGNRVLRYCNGAEVTSIRIPVPSTVSVSQTSASKTVHRCNSKRSTNDNSIFLSLKTGSQSYYGTVGNYVSTNGYTTDLPKIYDGDNNTFAQCQLSYVGEFRFFNFTRGETFETIAGLNLKINCYLRSICDNDSYPVYLHYSTDGGITWTLVDYVTFNHCNFYVGSDRRTYINTSIALSVGQVLSDIKVRVSSTVQNLRGCLAYIYECKLESIKSSSNISFNINPTKGMVGDEKITEIFIPVASETFAGASVSVSWMAQERSATGSILVSNGGSVTVAGGATYIKLTLTNPITLYDDDSGKYIYISLMFAGATEDAKINFYEAEKWFNYGITNPVTIIDSDGSYQSNYEPLIAFKLDKGTGIGTTEYAFANAFSGSISGPASSRVPAVIASGSIPYFNMEDLQGITSSGYDLVIFRSSSSDGYLYEVDRLIPEDLITFGTMGDSFDWTGIATADTFEVFAPNVILDFGTLSSTKSNETLLDPDTFNPLEDSMVIFRNRIFILARMEDTEGNLQTYVRWSWPLELSAWQDLDELYIPDGIVEIRPFRDDCLMAFSRTSTYSIIPSGDGFDYVKIADVGVGYPNLPFEYGTSKASRYSVTSNDEVIFFNSTGVYSYNGARVERINSGEYNLSILKDLIYDGSVSISPTKREVWFGSATTEYAPDKFTTLILNLDTRGMYSFVGHSKMHGIIEKTIGDEAITYFTYIGSFYREGEHYNIEGTPIRSVIKTKKFSGVYGSKMRTYYTGIRSKGANQTVALNIEGNNSTLSKSVINGSYDQFQAKRCEAYLTTEEVSIEAIHEADAAIEISGLFLGAAMIPEQGFRNGA